MSLPPPSRISFGVAVGTEGRHVRTRPQHEYHVCVRFFREALARLFRTVARWKPTAYRPDDHCGSTEAEELRQETLAKDKERSVDGQDEAGSGRDREVPPASGA